MAKILPHLKRAIQARHLQIVSSPSIGGSDLKVFENAISNQAMTGNRKALRKALWDYLERWGIQNNGKKKPLPDHDKGFLTLRANSNKGD